VLILHGLAGGWDELLVAVVAIGVLWLAIKLAGRKPSEEEEEVEEPATAEVDQEQRDRAPTP
jgi:hypothetical protein